MDGEDEPLAETFSISDIQILPEAYPMTVDPSLLSYTGESDSDQKSAYSANGSSTSSPPAAVHKPQGKQRRKALLQCREAIEKKYRDKLRCGLTELGNAIPASHVSSPSPNYNGNVTTGSTRPTKRRKKYTVITKAVEYIKHLEAENAIMSTMLSSALLIDEEHLASTEARNIPQNRRLISPEL